MWLPEQHRYSRLSRYFLISIVAVMMQWLSCWIPNPVFPGSNPGGGKVDSAFQPSEVGELNSSVINSAQVCRGCTDRHRTPR